MNNDMLHMSLAKLMDLKMCCSNKDVYDINVGVKIT